MTKEYTPEQMQQDFFAAVRAGHRTTAWEMIQEVMSRGLNYEQIQLDFVLPALQSIASLDKDAEEAEFLRAQATLSLVIERLRDSAPRESSHTPVVIIAGTAGDGQDRQVEKTAGELLCDMLSLKGWTASFIGQPCSADEVAGRAAATGAEIVMPLGFGPDAAARTAGIVDGVSAAELGCRIVLCGPYFTGRQNEFGDDKTIILPDIRAAYLLLSAAGPYGQDIPDGSTGESGGRTGGTAQEFLANALETSDIIFCTFSPDLTMLSVNRRCRDDFGMCQGENLRQYFEKSSAEIFAAMMKGDVLSSEIVEVSLMRHGEAYLVDALLIPCGETISLLAYARQEEMEKLTAILANYNREINALNCKLHRTEAAAASQQHTIEAAHAELKQAYDTLKSLEWHDPLTGAHNKHYYELVLVKEVNRAKRYGRHLSFLMIDVDNFGEINRDLGHPAGDAVLKHVVNAISENTRADIDWLARIGGDSFVLVLPETDMQGCMTVGEKLCNEIAARPLAFDDSLIPVTVSAGGACYDPSQTIHLSYRELPRQADAALASARKKGPNTVFINRLD